MDMKCNSDHYNYILYKQVILLIFCHLVFSILHYIDPCDELEYDDILMLRKLKVLINMSIIYIEVAEFAFHSHLKT